MKPIPTPGSILKQIVASHDCELVRNDDGYLNELARSLLSRTFAPASHDISKRSDDIKRSAQFLKAVKRIQPPEGFEIIIRPIGKNADTLPLQSGHLLIKNKGLSLNDFAVGTKGITSKYVFDEFSGGVPGHDWEHFAVIMRLSYSVFERVGKITPSLVKQRLLIRMFLEFIRECAACSIRSHWINNKSKALGASGKEIPIFAINNFERAIEREFKGHYDSLSKGIGDLDPQFQEALALGVIRRLATKGTTASDAAASWKSIVLSIVSRRCEEMLAYYRTKKTIVIDPYVYGWLFEKKFRNLKFIADPDKTDSRVEAIMAYIRLLKAWSKRHKPTKKSSGL